jgi:hypothetical protein
MEFYPEYPFDANRGENIVWMAIRASLDKEHGSALYRVPVVSKGGFVCYEPDIILISGSGTPVVVECKGCRLEQIVKIAGGSWHMSDDWYRRFERPIGQARDQALALRQLFRDQGIDGVSVRAIVALPFVMREEWMASPHAASGIDQAILFAEDLKSEHLSGWWRNHLKSNPLAPELAQSVTRLLVTESNEGADRPSEVGTPAARGFGYRSSPSTPKENPTTPQRPGAVTPGGLLPGLNFLRYGGSPPTAQQLIEWIGLRDDTSYTYLAATSALERNRRKEGLGGQHQLRKDLRREAPRPEEMQLLFQKALRHFIRRPVLTRAEESLLIQRAIRNVIGRESPLIRQQLLRDVFAWRDALAGLDQERIDLARTTDVSEEARWAHPELLAVARRLQAEYREQRRVSARGLAPFEETAVQYIENGFRPTSLIVMEGFTRLTPLQERFVRRCVECGSCVLAILAHRDEQADGFAAVEQAWKPLTDSVQATWHQLCTQPIATQPALRYLQTSLFSPSASAFPYTADGSVRIAAFPHRNDEIAAAVADILDCLGEANPQISRQDLAVVCIDPLGMASLLREEAGLIGQPDLFAIPPRQLLLTPVGRFALTLYEIWQDGHLHLTPEQFTALLAAGWLGSRTQHSFEQFEAVAKQQFTHCRTEEEWRAAFARLHEIRQDSTLPDAISQRLPSSCIEDDLLRAWELAFDNVTHLCRRLLHPGERPLGEHIRQLLDEIAQLDQHRIMAAERAVLEQIRDALAEIAQASSVAMEGEEFGRILAGLIHERDEPDSIGSDESDLNRDRVWVVGPEGIDGITRKHVYVLGLDDQNLPALARPPWPRGTWSVDEHIERQRYRFLAVCRGASSNLYLSFSHQDWEHDLQPSPYLERVAQLLGLEHQLRNQSAEVSTPTPRRPVTLKGPVFQRDSYTLEELATFQLCPHRFKMEALSEWGRCYGSDWQLGWLARGIWLAETFNHVASACDGKGPSEETLLQAMLQVKEAVRNRLAGLRALEWVTIEHDVRHNLLYIAQPWEGGGALTRILRIHGSHAHKSVLTPHSRTLRIETSVTYRQIRGSGPPLALPESDLHATWLMAGKRDNELPESEQRLSGVVSWWRRMTFSLTSARPLDPARRNQVLTHVLEIESGNFPKISGDHCRYCPIEATCLGVNS